MIAVGSDDPNPTSGTKVMIYEYSDSSRYEWNLCSEPPDQGTPQRQSKSVPT